MYGNLDNQRKKSTDLQQGRAGLVALRKSRAGGGTLGRMAKSYYKGGFESRMNKREAALILQLR